MTVRDEGHRPLSIVILFQDSTNLVISQLSALVVEWLSQSFAHSSEEFVIFLFTSCLGKLGGKFDVFHPDVRVSIECLDNFCEVFVFLLR